MTKERVEGTLKELVERGKLSAEDANKVASQIVDEGKREFEEARGKLEGALEDWRRKANFSTKCELEALAARVALLESKLGLDPEQVSADPADSANTGASADAAACDSPESDTNASV